MDSSLLIHCILLAALIAAVLYGGWSLTKDSLGSYYLEVFLAICSMTLGRLFIVVDTVANGTPEGFSLGSLGIVSAYFFLIGANLNVIRKEKIKLTGAARLIPLILSIASICNLIAVFVLARIETPYKIPSILLMVSAVPSLYLSLTVAFASKKEGSMTRGLKTGNILISILAVLSSLTESTWLLEDADLIEIYTLALTAACVVCFVLLMPVLRRDILKCKM